MYLEGLVIFPLSLYPSKGAATEQRPVLRLESRNNDESRILLPLHL